MIPRNKTAPCLCVHSSLPFLAQHWPLRSAPLKCAPGFCSFVALASLLACISRSLFSSSSVSCHICCHELCNMDAPSDLDTREGLVSLMQTLQVPVPLQDALLNSGIVCVADFAYAYADASDLNSFIAKQPEALWESMQVSDPEHSPAVARLRRTLDKCKAQASALEASSAPAPALPQASTPAASNVWAEHAPPRLDSEAVQRMQASFRANYPGEHLDADGMPSIRLLSLVHQWFTPKGVIKWVPWQLRMSQKQYQDIIEARTTRTLRTEAQLVSAALFDETPELSIDRAHLSPAWLARTQQIFRNAIALCNGAHLATLKAFNKKILDLCTQQLPADTGLRTVNTHELLQADRKIWNEVSSSTRHCMK